MSRFRTRMDAVRAGADDRVPPRGPSGRFMCWNCRAVEIPPRRQAYCSDQCADEYSIKNFPSVARAKVWERDQGICAMCGTDTFTVPARMEEAFAANPEYFAAHRWRYCRWEMDHIIPVVEGGGQCGLENLRTLCIPCHRQVTRELRARLAGKPTADPSLQPSLFESAA